MRISGRLGRKADMATIKEWEHGDHSIGVTWTHVDYGAAAALTRMGVTGALEALSFIPRPLPALISPGTVFFLVSFYLHLCSC